MIIYKITNSLTGKAYIGQTVRSFEERLSEHKRKANSTIGKAINKYGEDNFTYEIIDKASSVEELNELEFKYIREFNTLAPNGYNLVEGGGNTFGYSHTEDAKLKMSKSRKGRFNGESNSFYGKTHSEEQKAKWSHERSGRTLSESWRNNIAKANQVKVKIVELNKEFDSIKDCAEFLNLAPTNITRACKSNGKRKVRGYHVEYV